MHRGLPEGNTKSVLKLSRPWALPTIGPGLHEFLLNPASLALGLHGYACSTFTRSHAPKSTCVHMHMIWENACMNDTFTKITHNWGELLMIWTNYPNPTRSAAATPVRPVRPVRITPSTLPVRPVRPVLTEQCPKYIYCKLQLLDSFFTQSTSGWIQRSNT